MASEDIPTIGNTNVKLELGSIIRIVSPSNSDYNNKIFLITYIDDSQLELTGEDGVRKLRLIDGAVTDESVETIELLSDPEVKGFARQNGLTPRTWVDIYFGGDTPVVFTGEITSLEEDMIELTTYPEKDVIYIDFGYKGVPKDLPITSIQLRDKPVTIKEPSIVAEAVAESKGEDDDEEPAEDVEFAKEGAIAEEAPEVEFKPEDMEILDFEIGEGVTELRYEVEVPESEQRYNINSQAQDMYDSLILNIPKHKQTPSVLNRITTMVERFKQLRTELSVYDKNGIISGYVKKGATYKPLVEKIYELDRDMKWIIPVIQNKRKVYTNDEELDGTDEVDDIVLLNTNDVISDEVNLIQQYKDGSLEGDDKYGTLQKRLNAYFTPYAPPSSSNIDEVVHIGAVKDNIHVIADNVDDGVDDLNSSVVYRDAIANRRFVIEKYNLGLKRKVVNYRSRELDNIVDKSVTRNDTAFIKSFIVLSEPYMKNSQRFLPNSSILTKATLNADNFPYWKALHKRSNINEETINIDEEKEAEKDDTFLQTITHVKMEENDVEYDEELTDEEVKNMKFKKFLNMFIPKTRDLFEQTKKYMTNNVSFVKVISYLEPFMIYRNDISFKQFTDIREYIDSNIKSMKSSIARSLEKLNSLMRLPIGISYDGSVLLNMLKSSSALYQSSQIKQEEHSALKQAEQVNRNDYNITKDTLPGNVIQNIMTIDNGVLFANSVNVETQLLFSTIDQTEKLQSALDAFKAESKEKEEAVEKSSCKTRTLAKRYEDNEEMGEDNGTIDVFYDAKYDNTRYDIIDEYKVEQETMPVDEFKNFLVEKLKLNIGLSEEKAQEDADAMIIGRRRVRDGDYAYYTEISEDGLVENFFFKRVNMVWIPDETINNQTTEYDFENLCNLKADCIQVKQTCENIVTGLDDVVKDTSEKLITELMEAHMKETSETRNAIYARYISALDNIVKLKTLLFNMTTKYSTLKSKIGLTAEIDDTIVRSPHEKLRDIILGEKDEMKKKMNIVKFISKYTRVAYSSEIEEPSDDTDEDGGFKSSLQNEDPYWLYCVDTNTKLLPSFFKDLAQTTSFTYDEVVQQICRERGELSDDGSKWVDKFSGYVIKNIDFDTDEGYDKDGFVVSTHDIIEEDFETALQTQRATRVERSIAAGSVTGTEKVKRVYTKDEKFISNVINSLSISLGVNLNHYEEKIIDNVITVLGTILKPGEEDKKRKAFYSLMVTGLMVLFTIQTAVPSIKRGKSYPNCIPSLSGFPFYKDDDYSGLTYIVCIMVNTASSSSSWSVIKKFKKKPEKLVETMKKVFNKYISGSDYVAIESKRKLEYLATHGEEEEYIPEELDVKNTWLQFLPSLNPIVVERVRLLSEDFKSQLLNKLKTGSKEQLNDIRTLYSKIYLNSLLIQRNITDIVRREQPLITSFTGNPYLENACCMDDTIKTALSYFIKRDGTIKDINTRVGELDELYQTIQGLTIAPIMFSDDDTKLKYPSVIYNIPENVIYAGFIKYCMFNKDIPLSPQLRNVCLSNTSAFKDIDDLDEKIRIMKSEGKKYTLEMFLALMNVVNRSNRIDIDLTTHNYSKLKKLESYLRQMLEQEHVEEVGYAVERKEGDEDDEEEIIEDSLTSRQGVRAEVEEDIADIIAEDEPVKFRDVTVITTDLMELITKLTKSSTDEDIKNNKRVLITYLEKHIDGMKEHIQTFVEERSDYNRSKKQNVTRFVENFYELHELSATEYMSANGNSFIQRANYVRNMVVDMLVVFPMMILHNVSRKELPVLKHWNLAKNHYGDINTMISRSYLNLENFNDKITIRPLLQRILDESNDILEFMSAMPFDTQSDKSNRMFGSDVNNAIFEYVFLFSIYRYIHLTRDTDVVRKGLENKRIADIRDEGEGIGSGDVMAFDEGEQYTEEDFIGHEYDEVNTLVSNLICEYMLIFNNTKKSLNYNENTITERILMIRDKEKNAMVKRLGELTVEERRVSMMHRATGLGVWNVGLQKGLRTYVSSYYEDERKNDIERITRERRLYGNDMVNDMNAEIYMLEQEHQDALDAEIEREEYDMSHIGDDDEMAENEDEDVFYGHLNVME